MIYKPTLTQELLIALDFLDYLTYGEGTVADFCTRNIERPGHVKDIAVKLRNHEYVRGSVRGYTLTHKYENESLADFMRNLGISFDIRIDTDPPRPSSIVCRKFTLLCIEEKLIDLLDMREEEST